MNLDNRIQMIRPEWEAFHRATYGSYVLCSCHSILQTVEAVRTHWQLGHFDYVCNKELQDAQ